MTIITTVLQIDTDNNGVIDFEEFILMMTKHRADSKNDILCDLRQAFEVLNVVYNVIYNVCKVIMVIGNILLVNI